MCFLLLLSSFDLGCGKFVSGKINSSDNWVSVSQFYLIDETEHLDYNVEYAATNQCCPSLAYYFEDSWESVYNNSTMDCQSKINHAKAVFGFQNTPGSNKSIPDNFSIQCFTENATNLRQCSGTLRLFSENYQWWFFALSHCNSTRGLEISYEFSFTNRVSWEEKEHVLVNHLVSFGLILILFAISLYFARQLLRRDMFHRAYKLFLASLGYEFTALLFDAVYRTHDAHFGEGVQQLVNIRDLLHATSEIFLQVLLVLLAFGWTITKARLNENIQRKLTVFFSIYILIYGVLFFFKQEYFDHGQSILWFLRLKKLLQGNLGLTVIAWVVFISGALSTIRQNPEKQQFYLFFAGVFSIWFLAQPLPAFLASSFFFQRGTTACEIYHRLNFLLDLLGFGGLLYIMRPSQANRNFPFHAHANEVEPVQEQNPLANAQYYDGFSRFNQREAGPLEANQTTIDRLGGNEDRNRVFQ